MATPQIINLPLPALPEGWSAEKDFKAIGTLSSATQRSVEPVGPHFLAHARRVCHCPLSLHYLSMDGSRGVDCIGTSGYSSKQNRADTPLEASQPHVLRR